VAKRKDLKSLCQVSKYICAITLPILYQCVVFEPKDEYDFEYLSSEDIAPARDKGYFHHARSIEVTSPFHVNNGPHRRCTHFRPGRATHLDLENTLESSLLLVLKSCGDGMLRSFR
jgi:hypothetical protein